MNSGLLNSALTFVLGVLVVLGVIFALQTINRTRETRGLQVEVAAINNSYMRLQALAADVNAYNQKTPNPDLTRILQSVR
jgi:hypothetical protein